MPKTPHSSRRVSPSRSRSIALGSTCLVSDHADMFFSLGSANLSGPPEPYVGGLAPNRQCPSVSPPMRRAQHLTRAAAAAGPDAERAIQRAPLRAGRSGGRIGCRGRALRIGLGRFSRIRLPVRRPFRAGAAAALRRSRAASRRCCRGCSPSPNGSWTSRPNRGSCPGAASP